MGHDMIITATWSGLWLARQNGLYMLASACSNVTVLSGIGGLWWNASREQLKNTVKPAQRDGS
jgi:hypothetical protein